MPAGQISAVSKAGILPELRKLSTEERFGIRLKLAEMDSDGWLALICDLGN